MDDKQFMTMDEFKTVLSDMLDVKMRELGMDKVERKHGMFPAKDDPNGDSLKDLDKDQRIMKFIQSMVFNDMATVKALSEGTAADGGYLVPAEFRASVIAKRDKVAVIRPRATKIPMSRDKMDIPAEGNAVTMAWTAENAALTESNPTFGTVQLNTNKLTGLSKMSRELFADSAINLVDYLAGIFGRALAKEEDKVFTAGDGSGKPKGIRTYTFAQTLAQAAGSLAADDLIKLFYKLPVQYRDAAAWLLHNDIIQKVRLLKDSNGRYLWTDGFNDAPNTLLGRPVLEQNDIPTNLGAGTNESEIYFGDLSYYLIGDRQDMTMETTTEGAGTFENHQVAVKVIERVDGQLGQTVGFAQLTAVK